VFRRSSAFGSNKKRRVSEVFLFVPPVSHAVAHFHLAFGDG
jgi:hypothetical protein